MTHNPLRNSGPLLRESFENYRWDNTSTITWIRQAKRSECQDILISLWESAPNCLARELAINWPMTADQCDEIEGRVQGQLRMF